ncbi:MAG TPA: hypothetical protein VFQ42_21995 [Mycobacterium sp.]|nr:hypothetical protein [Mycobacterium sp.]
MTTAAQQSDLLLATVEIVGPDPHAVLDALGELAERVAAQCKDPAAALAGVIGKLQQHRQGHIAAREAVPEYVADRYAETTHPMRRIP